MYLLQKKQKGISPMTHFAGKAVRTLVLAVATVLILTASAFAAEDTMAVAVGSTTGSSLRLRAKASTSSSIVRVLDKGTAVAVLDKSIDGWYKIAYEGKTGFVSAEGLGANPDNLHFNAAALYEFGLRYFEEFEKVRDPNKVFAEKPGVNEAFRTGMELL